MPMLTSMGLLLIHTPGAGGSSTLPHGLRYFEHFRIRATTDLDLINMKNLDEVVSTVETAGIVPEGCEMWVREGPIGRQGFRQTVPAEPVVSWVDHRARRIPECECPVRWRQQYFRPHKPLPQDVPHVQPARKRVPIGRKIVDIFVGILCLDISLLFVGRPRFVHIIGVMAHHSGLLIPVGACACLVAAIILSTSVTLRGLDSIGHIAGLVVTLCSAASMVSSVAALYPIQD